MFKDYNIRPLADGSDRIRFLFSLIKIWTILVAEKCKPRKSCNRCTFSGNLFEKASYLKYKPRKLHFS